MSRRLLLVLAIAGVALSLGLGAARSIDAPEEADAQFILLAVFLVLMPLLALALKRARRTLRLKPGLLVPLGVTILVYLVIYEAHAAWFLDAGHLFDLDVGVLAFHVSVLFLLTLLVAVAYATWATALVVQAVEEDDDDPVRALHALRGRFLVVLGCMVVGWAVTLVPVVLLLAAASETAVELALVLVPLWTVWWNLRSAPLLLVAVRPQTGFGAAIREGLALGRRLRRRWAWPVILQLLLLGVLTFMHVRTTRTDEFSGHYTMTETSNWTVNAIWTGGYADECKWHAQYVALKGLEALPVVTAVLAVLFGLFALLVKIHVAQTLARPEGHDLPRFAPPEPDTPSEGESPDE